MSRRIKWLLYSLAAVFVLSTLLGIGAYLYLRVSLPQTAGEISLPQLDAPVVVARDSHGIPTIKAENLPDAYKALGFVHAQDRLWQMDFTRRTARGELAELIGEPVLGLDKFMRVMGFGHIAEQQIKSLSAPMREALDAYASGVNAFLATEHVLPLEFQALQYEPEPWRPADSLTWLRLMALQLSGNWREEIERVRVAEKLTSEQMSVLYGDDQNSGVPTIETMKRAAKGLPWDRLANLVPYGLEPKSASNAWVLSGEHAAGGKPILANDPHLGLNAPGYWYLARIETPEHTLVGATAPGVPMMVLGRNRHLAWGLTTTHSDTQDLFIEKLDPEQASHYLTPNGSEPFRVRKETIEVAGREKPVTLDVRHTRHGPVISDSVDDAASLVAEEDDRVIALAWPGLAVRDRTMDAIRRVTLAKDVPTALTALDLVGSPQQNIHLADDSGNIAVSAPGHVPVRRDSKGLYPSPGWKFQYNWKGLIPVDGRPQRVNPANGQIVNANNKLVPDSYPFQLAASWPPPYRAERIRKLLRSSGVPADLDRMREIQLDTKSAAPDIMLPMLLRHGGRTSRGKTAIKMLRAWDGQMDRTRPEPLIFVAWMDTLNQALLRDELGTLFGEFRRPSPSRLKRILESAPAWCDDTTTDEITETCEGQIQIALEQALTDLARSYGNDLKDWRWGDAHRAMLPHPALSRVPLVGGFFETPIPTDGGDETVNRGGALYEGRSPGERYRHVHGAGLRALHDLSQPPSSSRFMIADGQSGNPLSPHYAGLARLWQGGRYVKLVGETQEAQDILRLTPATE